MLSEAELSLGGFIFGVSAHPPASQSQEAKFEILVRPNKFPIIM